MVVSATSLAMPSPAHRSIQMEERIGLKAFDPKEAPDESQLGPAKFRKT